MKKSSSITLILLLSLSFLASIQPASANFSVDVYINNAYYDDLDADGLDDDIKVDLTIYLSNSYIYTDIEIYVGITLPSGVDFWFSYTFTAVKYKYTASTDMHWDLMNTALEPGWYWADAVGFAEGERFSNMDSLLFDPPGGVDGHDPIGFISFPDNPSY